MTLQSFFVGEAQQAYSSLSLEDAADSEKIKQAVLRIYSFFPEAYSRGIANTKSPTCSLVRFVREKEVLFDRWLNSEAITTFNGLLNLIILQAFKSRLPKSVAMLVSEHKGVKPSSAALSKEFEDF